MKITDKELAVIDSIIAELEDYKTNPDSKKLNKLSQGRNELLLLAPPCRQVEAKKRLLAIIEKQQEQAEIKEKQRQQHKKEMIKRYIGLLIIALSSGVVITLFIQLFIADISFLFPFIMLIIDSILVGIYNYLDMT